MGRSRRLKINRAANMSSRYKQMPDWVHGSHAGAQGDLWVVYCARCDDMHTWVRQQGPCCGPARPGSRVGRLSEGCPPEGTRAGARGVTVGLRRVAARKESRSKHEAWVKGLRSVVQDGRRGSCGGGEGGRCCCMAG